MRVWIDVTNSPHVPFFRPLIAPARANADTTSTVTARDFAQTLELLDAAQASRTTSSDRHTGAPARAGKARAMARAPARAPRAGPRPQHFDLALSHASHELPLAARSLGVPSAYAFDYEFARAQHTLGSRAATRVVAPGRRSRRSGSTGSARARAKVRRYPGLKEEYYLAGFAPDPACLDAPRARSVDACSPSSALRPRSRSTTVTAIRSSRTSSTGSATTRPCRRWCCRAPPAQRDAIRAAALPSLVVPEHAIDAQSLVALADLVVSAGGTMNREAVALGTPVWTTFAGRIGAVDEALIAAGRLAELTAADALVLAKKEPASVGDARDPGADARPAASRRSPADALPLTLRFVPYGSGTTAGTR